MRKIGRQKGKRGEYEIRDKIRGAGIEAERVPVSGVSSGFKGDIWFKINDVVYKGEVKRRKSGFTTLYKWLEGKDALFLRDDYRGWLVVLPLDVFLSITSFRLEDKEE
jgi:Holliday junction resolvase